MRFRVLASSCLLIAVSAGGVKTLAASPDCARWIREYQQGLAKRAVLAKKHVVHAARHIGVPRPKLVHTGAPVHRLRPARLSPQEMLKRFRVLCGEDLPEDSVPVAFVPASLDALMVPPVFFPDAMPLTDVTGPVSFTPTPVTPDTPQTPPTAVPPATGVPGVTLPPIYTPPVVIPPTSNTPGGPTPPVVVPPVTDSPVPEPDSLILLLTGALGAVPILLRRRRAA